MKTTNNQARRSRWQKYAPTISSITAHVLSPLLFVGLSSVLRRRLTRSETFTEKTLVPNKPDPLAQALQMLDSNTTSTRIAGVHALTELADNQPDIYKTRVVGILTRYLRTARKDDGPVEAAILNEFCRHLVDPYRQIPGTELAPEQLWNELTIDLNGAVFTQTVNFGCLKLGPLNCAGAQFNARADFQATDFNGPVDFMGTQFNSDADFRFASFNETTYLIQAEFDGKAAFSFTEFNGDTYFSAAKFNGSTCFSSSQHNGETYFETTEFNSDASFEEAKFSIEPDWENIEVKHPDQVCLEHLVWDPETCDYLASDPKTGESPPNPGPNQADTP